nr:MAG TPA: hypothetical protein [Bacteriophage sp.]
MRYIVNKFFVLFAKKSYINFALLFNNKILHTDIRTFEIN